MSINLDNLSLKDLKALQISVAKAIADFGDRQRRAAVAELEEIARARGFTFAELAGVAAPRKRAPAAAKYANPANRSDTWSGRGRKPRWFDAALKAGKSPEDLAI